MEGKDADLLLGLDMLKRYQMCIDLRGDALIVQGKKIPFLPENQLPKMIDEILENEPKIEGPEGTKIGATTGTVEQVENPSPSSKVPAHDASKPSLSKITIHPAGLKGNVHSNPSGQSSTTASRSQIQQPASGAFRTSPANHPRSR
jgi:DNA damage-inducible protein 1